MLIAIEGIDGSGKGTQTRLLEKRLANEGWGVSMFSFPRYNETFFGREVGNYLDGKFGGLEAVDPKFSSLLYALDRYETAPLIEEALARGNIVICDRYVGSNIAHQCARVPKNKVTEMATWIRAARNLYYEAAWRTDEGKLDHALVAMAKWFSAQIAVRCADEALQMHGGYGYIDEYKVQRLYRDAKILEIYEGTKEMEKVIIARSLLG